MVKYGNLCVWINHGRYFNQWKLKIEATLIIIGSLYVLNFQIQGKE